MYSVWNRPSMSASSCHLLWWVPSWNISPIHVGRGSQSGHCCGAPSARTRRHGGEYPGSPLRPGRNRLGPRRPDGAAERRPRPGTASSLPRRRGRCWDSPDSRAPRVSVHKCVVRYDATWAVRGDHPGGSGERWGGRGRGRAWGVTGKREENRTVRGTLYLSNRNRRAKVDQNFGCKEIFHKVSSALGKRWPHDEHVAGRPGSW